MAKINNGHFGSYQGKIGAVTGRKRKGRFYISQSITKNASKSKYQVKQRLLFNMASKILSKFASVAAVGFRNSAAPGLTALNALSKFNFHNVDSTTMKLIYNKAMVSRGSYGNVQSPTLANEDPGKVTSTWTFVEDSDPNVSGNDMVYLFLYEETTNTSKLASALRKDHELVVPYPANWASKTAQAWIFTVSEDGSKNSDSQYLGQVTCE